jgi:hypothetical protein
MPWVLLDDASCYSRAYNPVRADTDTEIRFCSGQLVLHSRRSRSNFRPFGIIVS